MPAEGEARVRGGAGAALPHDSARLHVCGEARYVDDLAAPRGTLHAAVGVSARPHARLRSVDLEPVRRAAGVVAVIAAADLPAANDLGGMLRDEPILAADAVHCVGQAIFAVAATSVEAARRAVGQAVVDYEDLEPILDVDAALERESWVLPTMTLARGDSAAALAAAPHRLQGRLRIGGQEHFYLEGQVALAEPQEGGAMRLHSSTQHPGQVQLVVAAALGVAAKDVAVECRRMGGAFGGKESQAAQVAVLAALLAARTGRAVKLRLDRDLDMTMTGKRHDFRIDYDVGFDDDGMIRGLALDLAARCGMSADLSGPVNDRALFHADNCYYLGDVTITSRRCRTHTVSNTAFRGFGGPQGMIAIEQVLDEVARHLGLDPLDVRRRNFYGVGERDATPYGMRVEDNLLPEIVPALVASSDYAARRREIAEWNAASPVLKRGLALTPVKFGISFTATHLNQAGALVHIYSDGSVQLNHGGTEMGQGLFVKVAQVVAEELQIDVDRIRCTASDTAKVPNASATAASAGTDLNGMAAQEACRKLRRRLTELAARRFGVSEDEVVFAAGTVRVGERTLSFDELVAEAWKGRVSLSATGFYRTPRIHYDRDTLSGRPFFYFAWGAAVSEAVIDTLTGESRVLRVDILHDVGRSLNPAVDRGQIEGGFAQGMGWLTTEELWWDAGGTLRTHAPSTYKIPTASDLPADWRVRMLESAGNREETIHRSKAVGEPPLMLALSVFFAIKDAVAAVGGGAAPRLDAPATPEAVLRAVDELRQRGSG